MKRATQGNGFTLVEVLIALVMFAIVMAVVFVFLDRSHKILETESSDLETRHAARVALEEMAYHIQQAGYGVERNAPYNAGAWQRDLVYGDSHTIVFNADIDPDRGPIPLTVGILLPDGSTYKGEGPASSRNGAETYIYTLDADQDGAVTALDQEGGSGGYHPSAEAENPLDWALFRRIYGYDGSSYDGALQPITGYLYTNATADDKYPDSTSPQPLFTYWMTEDLSRDGVLDPHECTVPPCPPSGARGPLLYIWGDGNFDGRLSETEKANLRGLPVGDAGWDRNPRASGGSYHATMLASDAGPASSVVQVDDASDFGAGDVVEIGSGGEGELVVVSSVDTSASPDEIQLTAPPSKTHASGATLTIHPRTMMRAVRTVDVGFDAITPRRDYDATTGRAGVGRAGRVGSRGLDYRVMPFVRSVELTNQQARGVMLASNNSPGDASSQCPDLFVAYIDSQETSSVDLFVPRTTPVPLSFIMLDKNGDPMSGYSVFFSNASSSHGSVTPANAMTDVNGIATVMYTPTGVYGTDTITAMHPCIKTALGGLFGQETDLTLRIHEVRTAFGTDCMATIRDGLPNPVAAYSVRVRDPSGSFLTDFPLELTLAFDPANLPAPPDFGKVQGQLIADGIDLGLTGAADGTLGPEPASTGSAGGLNGTVTLTRDVDREGARLVLTSTVASPNCSVCGASVDTDARFFRLWVDSVTPAPGCYDTAPCSLAAGALPPRVQATLTLGQNPIVGAQLTFTTDDYQQPAPTAQSSLLPASGWVTDFSGNSVVEVIHNGDPAVGPLTPLKTRIAVESNGGNNVCNNAAINSLTPRSEFWFLGPLSGF